jgi:hypothetical protein
LNLYSGKLTACAAPGRNQIPVIQSGSFLTLILVHPLSNIDVGIKGEKRGKVCEYFDF